MDEVVIQGVFSIAVALITLTGVFLTAFVSVYSLKKESYNKRVTEERIKWLNKRRLLYGTIMAAWVLKKTTKNNSGRLQYDRTFYDQKRLEAEKAKAEFISRLNTSSYPGNEYNFYIKDVVSRMDFIKGIDDFDSLDAEVEKMKAFVNKRLEQEWQRSKEETN